MVVGGLPNLGQSLLCCHPIPAGLPAVPPPFDHFYYTQASASCVAKSTVIFDPVNIAWILAVPETPDLSFSRYYPTATTTSTGYPIVYGGTLDALCPASVGFVPATPLPGTPAGTPVVDGKYVTGFESYVPPVGAGAAAWTASPGAAHVDNPTDPYPFWADYTAYNPTTFPATSYFRYYPRGHLLAKINPSSPTEAERIFVGGDTHVEWKYPPPDTSLVGYLGYARQPENVLRRSQAINVGAGTIAPAGVRDFAVPPAAPPVVGCGTITTDPPVGCYGNSVLLHTREGLGGTLVKNRVLSFAGGHGSANVDQPNSPLTAVGTNTVMEWDDASGMWRGKAPLVETRIFSNAVVLPSRQVLVVGGYVEDNANWDGSGGSFTPRVSYELHDPGATSAACGSSALWSRPNQTALIPAVQRGYHSMAFLLPDGRVVLCGGFDDNHQSYAGGIPPNDSYEVYSPPYMFVPRPVVKSAPATIGYASLAAPSFSVVVELKTATQDPSGFALSLIRPASITHHFDAEQRYLEMDISAAVMMPGNPKRWTLTVNPPSDGTLMQPGYYMLFFRNGSSVSSSKTVRLQ